ncbi:hypothetical protein BLOT_011564 [Blomia tropicalis]|nr:hypothetical protein BLOT_011564 [Blomia tropicalis]
MKKLTVITGNIKKLNEIVSIVGTDSPFEIVHRKIDLPEYQGDLNFIVTEKCKHAARIVDGPVLVEDTSLNIEALGGLPGPYIKWFVDKLGPNGIHRMISDWTDKTATAICMIAYSEAAEKPIQVFKGICKGTIVKPRGDNQFGWDPCFQPDGFDQTFAEMDVKVKNEMSHRFNSLKALREYLIQLKN